MYENSTITVGSSKLPVIKVEVLPGIESESNKLSFQWSVIEMNQRELKL